MTPFSLLVAVLGWLCLGLETGLKATLSLPVGPVEAGPSFVVPLMVFVCVWAAPQQALWSALALGLSVDLLTRHPTEAGNLVVVGPYALGYLVAAQLVLAMRGLVIRRNFLTTGVLSILASVVLHIVVTAIFTARHLYDPAVAWSPISELTGRMIGSLLTGLSGVTIGVLLMPLAPALGGGSAQARHYGRR